MKTKQTKNLERECMLDPSKLKLLEEDFNKAGITDETERKNLIEKCGKAGVTTINPYGLLKIVDFYKERATYEGKRCTSMLRTFATVISLLALEAGLVFFYTHQDAHDTRKYIQSIDSQLEQTKRNDSNVYALMKCGKFKEATNSMEKQIKAYQGGK